MYVCISVWLTSTPCTFNSWQVIHSPIHNAVEICKQVTFLIFCWVISGLVMALNALMGLYQSLMTFRKWEVTIIERRSTRSQCVWRTQFGLGYWPVIRQQNEWMTSVYYSCSVWSLFIFLFRYSFVFFPTYWLVSCLMVQTVFINLVQIL